MADIVPATELDMKKLIDEISTIVFTDDHAKDEKKFLQFVNQDPFQSWIREMNGIPYIPIGILETLMQKVFGKVRYEVKDFKIIANSICVCVRVHYWNAARSDWDFQDGLGAIPIQISKTSGAGATDFANMNSKAIQLGLPAAESFAMKDAIEKIGRLFGRDISRKDAMEYRETFTEPVDLKWAGFEKSTSSPQ